VGNLRRENCQTRDAVIVRDRRITCTYWYQRPRRSPRRSWGGSKATLGNGTTTIRVLKITPPDLFQFEPDGRHCVAASPALLATQASNGGCIFPLRNPITDATGYFGGMAIHICTWSGIRWPSIIPRMPSGAVWARTRHSTGSPIWNGTGSGKTLTLNPPHRWSNRLLTNFSH
jgi:hypothetical protein